MDVSQKNAGGPRVIDIDLLAWDDLVQLDEKLHLPHKGLLERPFALWPLADIAPRWIYPALNKTAAEIVQQWGSRFDGQAPFHTKQIPHRIDTPELMGILNIAPDSFSDGGKFIDTSAALLRAQELVNSGANILDLGAEATNPKVTAISSQQEWERLEPVLNAILRESANWIIKPKISIDTRHVDVAQKALAIGADWINDVSGLDDPAMIDLIAAQTCDVVFMHHLGIPVDKNKFLPREKNPVTEVLQWAEKRLAELEKNGITRERLIFDVGIGFGKTADQCLELIQQIHQFHSLGTRLLVGHSRKLFLGQFTDKPFAERDIETTVLSLFLAQKNIDYLRVHNIEITARGLKTYASMM